jgi:branched-chain amino acid transport system substrate-binding protein
MRKFYLWAAALAAAVLVTAGCGSSSPAAGTGGASTSSLVRLGFICSCSGSGASSFNGSEQTLQAWADSVNASGGLGGHHVILYTVDDSDNATTALTQVKTLVQGDHVVAIVGEESSQDPVWASYVASQGVPVVGGNSVDVPFSTNPDFFPSGTTLIATILDQLSAAKRYGPRFAGLYCAESPTCAAIVPLMKAGASELGMQVVYNAPFSSSAPNYTAICQAIKDSGANSYTVGSSAQTVVNIVSACHQQGVTAKIVQVVSTIGASLPGTPGADGGSVTFPDFPYFDDSVPGSKQFHSVLSRYYPQYSSGNGTTETYVWTAAQLLQAAVAAAPAGPITSAGIKTGLYALHDDTLGGLAPPLTFTKGKPASVNCDFVGGIGATSFTEPQGLAPSCPSATQIAGLAGALQ